MLYLIKMALDIQKCQHKLQLLFMNKEKINLFRNSKIIRKITQLQVLKIHLEAVKMNYDSRLLNLISNKIKKIQYLANH